MKHKIHRGLGALIFFLLTTFAASATTRTRKATQAFADDADAEDAVADTVDEERNLMLSEVPKPASGGEAVGGAESSRSSSAFLEVSKASGGQAVLDRLAKVEAVAESQKQALRSQQEVLVALQEQEEYLQAHERELEANEVAMEKHMQAERVADAVQDPTTHHPHLQQALQSRKSRSSDSQSDMVILLHDTESEFWNRNNKAFWRRMIGVCLYMIQVFIGACIYMQIKGHAAVPQKLPESDTNHEAFQYGPFACQDIGRDWSICFWAFCCSWVRWADTASRPQVDFLAFVPGLFIMALLSSSASVTFGASFPILILIAVLCRQRVRDAYGLASGSCKIIFTDCLLWIFCPCCAIVQEARQVEYVQTPMMNYGP